MEDSFVIEVDGARTTARVYGAHGHDTPPATMLLAHGAGAPQTHPWMVTAARALSARGLAVVTFNFLYSEERRRVPDKNDVLEATFRAAIQATRARSGIPSGRLFVGGKSMGGRIATQVAAGGDETFSGLVLLGYPLHPPGKPQQLRASHLPRVRAPMLFVQGSRDSFGTPDELGPIARGLAPGTRLFVVEGGDHSLSLPKRGGGETIDKTLGRVADEVVEFSRACR